LLWVEVEVQADDLVLAPVLDQVPDLFDGAH
jgi:hypothetical protein